MKKSFVSDMQFSQKNLVNLYGRRGEQWLSKLPRRIEQLKKKWKLSKLQPLPNLSYSYVLEGFKEEACVILKLSPDVDLIDQEARALNAFKGFGAVSVIGYDRGALLLERAVPGDSLKNSVPQENRIEIACNVIEKLHRAPLHVEGVFPHIEEWLTAIDKEWDLPQEHLHRARKLKNKLLKNRPTSEILLHGDLHQENILSHENGWVVIDPKGVIGSPIHEVWACVEDSKHDLKVLSTHFGYPFQDVVEWYYVRLILAACWQLEDGLDAIRFLKLAETALSMIES